ncbi:MAG: GNAT family N-acetyltransferase [Barnesiella sp.]|nr:GNAT family N-acetyltransferase [Bacteroidales bacterium]MBD5247781.1 GNAT family N-acetyltransferase [Barnesiella sp.]
MKPIDDTKVTLSPIMLAADLEAAKEIYLDAFPPAEQRPWDMIESRCDGRLTLTGVRLADRLVGMLTTWSFDDFVYVEHFVIDPTLRGRGIGSAAMRLLQQQCAPLPILLEAEPEHQSEQARHRIRFYRTLGFDIIDRSYVQPPYDTYLPPVHLWLMSTDASLDAARSSLLLHRQVYNVAEA